MQQLKATNEQFKQFKSLQESGTFNMIDPQVREILGITKEQHGCILKNYDKYLTQEDK